MATDGAVFTRFGGIRGKRLVGIEVQVALDGKAYWAACFAKLAHTDEANCGRTHAKIAEAVGNVVQPKFCQQPGALGVGREELDHGFKIDVGMAGIVINDLRLGRSRVLNCDMDVATDRWAASTEIRKAS